MSRFVAFLRGMNVGGHRITNPELCAHFERMDLGEVSAFLASGNVLFSAEGGSGDDLRERIEGALEEVLGYAVPTFLRSAEEVCAIADHEAFDASTLEGPRGKLQIALFSRQLSQEAERAVLAHSTEDDRLAVHGRELYWLPRGGVSESELDFKAIETLLGGMTVRTHRTLERLAVKLSDK
ncbi:MAG: DUF1697 domain-containing protein [Acidobacteriota bacterium]